MESTVTQFIRAQKPNTQRVFNSAFRGWMDYLAEIYGERSYENVSRASTRDAAAYIELLRNREGIAARRDPCDTLAANSTIHTKLGALKRIYNVLLTEGELNRNVFNTFLIKVPSREARMKRQTEEIPLEIIPILLKLSNSTRQSYQLRALMTLLLAGGLRLSEGLDLSMASVCDLSGDFPYIILRCTKSDKDFQHPIAIFAKDVLREQVDRRKKEGGNRLFITYSTTGRILRAEYLFRSAARHIKTCFNKIGLRFCSSHSFRKTFANVIADKEDNIRLICDALRHSSLDMTERYLQKRKSRAQSPIYDKNNFEVCSFLLAKKNERVYDLNHTFNMSLNHLHRHSQGGTEEGPKLTDK